MTSEITTAAPDTAVPIGRLIGGYGSAGSRGSTSRQVATSPTSTGSAIQSYVPVRPTWEPDGYLEGESYAGLPYVPESAVPEARKSVALAIKHAEAGLVPVGELPQGDKAISALIGQIRSSKNAARMTAEEADLRIKRMKEELADIPFDILRDAVKQVRLSGDERDDWFPTGGRIRAAAASELARRRLRLMRLREWQRDLERRAKAQEEANRPLSAEERAELEMLNARRKNAGYVPDPNSPPPGIDQATWAEMLAKAKRQPVGKS